MFPATCTIISYMSLRPTRWQVQPRQSDDLLEHLCRLRSFDHTQLEPNYEDQLHDPFLLPDMKIACELIERAVAEKQTVTIFGDYDADGTPASALLSIVFNQLGVKNSVLLPTRETGYGLRREDILAIAKTSQLLVTVDTGITSVEEITAAKELGLKVIVLDHHLPKETLPPADAVVDPFVENSKYPFPNLCGCALAFKLSEALATIFPNLLTPSFRKWLLDLVAVSTVADMMIMRGENRVLVHYGLKVLRKNRRLGLSSLLKVAGIEASTIDAGIIGYAIGPRLNASGRLGDNRPALDLLTATDRVKAEAIAAEIEKSNRTRQQLVETVLKDAEAKLFQQNSLDDRFFVLTDSAWQPGVLGLVAGKLAANYQRPVVVLTKKGTQFVGSGRSPQTYRLIDGLSSQQQHLTRFGGHSAAAGLAVEADNLEKFTEGVKAHAAGVLTDTDLLPLKRSEAVLRSDEVTLSNARKIQQLSPFGLENAQPLLIVPEVIMSQPKTIGRNNNHIKSRGRISGQEFDIIGFGLASTHLAQNYDQPMDCMGYLEENVWNNIRKLQLRVVDYRAHGQKIEVVS